MGSEPHEWQLDDAAAEYYEAHFVPAIFAGWAPLLADAADIVTGDKVLDVTCGTGVLTREIADRLAGGGEVIGLDLNASMLRVANRLRPDIEWREGDAMQLPFPNASFDAVTSQAGLMFIPDPVGALQEMRRVLRPGGRLAVLVWGPSEGYERIAVALQSVSGDEVAGIFRAPFALQDPDRVRELLREAGFAAPELATHERPARFPSLEALLKTEIDGWVLRGRVEVDALLPIVRETLAPYVGADGDVAIPMAGHIVHCKNR